MSATTKPADVWDVQTLQFRAYKSSQYSSRRIGRCADRLCVVGVHHRVLAVGRWHIGARTRRTISSDSTRSYMRGDLTQLGAFTTRPRPWVIQYSIMHPSRLRFRARCWYYCTPTPFRLLHSIRLRVGLLHTTDEQTCLSANLLPTDRVHPTHR